MTLPVECWQKRYLTVKLKKGLNKFLFVKIFQRFVNIFENTFKKHLIMATKLNLDKLDLQIIHEMMETAEISYAELGKKLFVSGGTIHVRIKKLQEFGIVKGTD